MNTGNANFRFFEELSDFFSSESLPVKRNYNFKGNPSIKDAIEAQGVPHTEVNMVTVNGLHVDFSYKLKDGDKVDVYPASCVTGKKYRLRLRNEPEHRFILDVHLGKLARLMRLAGFDCLYENDYNDHQIADISKSQERIVLTRDRRLLKFSSIVHGYWIRSHNPEDQLREVINRYSLHDLIDPFNRCLECNGKIEPVDKDSVIHCLEPKTILYFRDFYQCENCKKVYWKGSHYEYMQKFLEKLR